MTMLEGTQRSASFAISGGRRGAEAGSVKSATRALEVMELFTVRRHALSVGEVAEALAIPQSSSSVLLQALTHAGFIARDRATRKYLPSIRSVFLGSWIHDQLFSKGSLLRSLDALALETRASVRIGVRNGVFVQYVHVSAAVDGSASQPGAGNLVPGMQLAICHDGLGHVLLAAEEEGDLCGIIRHANALNRGRWVVDAKSFAARIRRQRRAGFAECADLVRAGESVLAVPLLLASGFSAAIGLGLSSQRLAGERDGLLAALAGFVAGSQG